MKGHTYSVQIRKKGYKVFIRNYRKLLIFHISIVIKVSSKFQCVIPIDKCWSQNLVEIAVFSILIHTLMKCRAVMVNIKSKILFGFPTHMMMIVFYDIQTASVHKWHRKGRKNFILKTTTQLIYFIEWISTQYSSSFDQWFQSKIQFH